MRRIATISALAALVSGLPLIEAAAGDRSCYSRRGGCSHYAAAVSPYAAWLAYYRAQAEVSFARRAARANYYVATGRAPPARYLGPPTNYYAEGYALEPYAYFNCPLARRGEGVCASLPPLSVVP